MTATRKTTSLRLTDRDQRVVQHVARNRITVPEVLGRTILPGLSYNGLSKLTSRLCKGGVLCRYPLRQTANYFALGQVGVRLAGLGDHRVAPLGPQSLPVEYAVLAHAMLGKLPRTRLTTEEILSRNPWLPLPLASVPHCLDERQQVLELVRVDLGGPADHVARKCAQDIARRQQLPEFAAFVFHGRFRIVVITGTAEKSVAIRQALDHQQWPSGLMLHLSVVPKLLPLLAS